MKTSLLLAAGALAIGSLTIYKIMTEEEGEGGTLIVRSNCPAWSDFPGCCDMSQLTTDFLANKKMSLFSCLTDANKALCIGKALDIVNNKGEVDKFKLGITLSQIFDKYPQIKDNAINKCIYKNQTKTRAPSQCDITTTLKCTFYVILEYCPPKATPDTCVEIRKTAEACLAAPIPC